MPADQPDVVTRHLCRLAGTLAGRDQTGADSLGQYVAARNGPAFTALVVALGVLVGGAAGRQVLVAEQPPPSGTAAAVTQPAAQKPARHSAARTDRYGDPLPPGALMRLGTIRMRPGTSHSLIAFLLGDKTLLTVGGEARRAIAVWEVATGKRLRRFTCPEDIVSASLTADGRTLATASYDRRTKTWMMRIWDVMTGKERLLASHPSIIHAVAFAPDGTTLASAHDDQTIYLWDPATGAERGRLTDRQHDCSSLRFSPDGKTLAAASYGRTLTLWDLASGRPLHQLNPHPKWTYALAFSPDSRTLATTGLDDPFIRLWDRATGRAVRQFKAGGWAYCLGFSPDGKTLAAGSHGDYSTMQRWPAQLWDVATGKERRLAGHLMGVGAVAFSRDGKVLASVGDEGVLHFWDVATGRDRLHFAEHESWVESVAFAPDGRTLATAGWDGTIRTWETGTGKALRRIDAGEKLYQVAWSPDGRALAAVGENKPIRLWDAATGKEIIHFGGPEPWRFSCRFSPDGRTLATGAGGRALRVWDVAGGKELHRFTTELEKAIVVGFSPDGRSLIAASEPIRPREGSAASVWDLASGKRVRQWSLAKSNHAWPFALSPDGRTVAASENWPPGDTARTLHFWDPVTGKERAVAMPQTVRTFGLAFSPDGKTLAWGNEDGTVVLWEMATDHVRRRFQAHASIVYGLAFTPDGRTLATSSTDSTVLLWDLTGQVDAAAPPAVSAAELDRLWTRLGDADAARAYDTLWRLVVTPGQSVPWLRNHVRPAVAADAQRVRRLVADLGSPRFATREKATRALERLGESAAAAVREALADQPAPEVRRRLEALLAKSAGPVGDPELLRSLRAVEVLEHIASRDAVRVLRTLAEGTPSARITREARAALDRLEKRQAARR